MKATTITDGVGTSYAKFSTSTIELYAASSRGLTVDSTGGTLHGAWSSDATVTTSDRRLKKNIEPLYRTLASRFQEKQQFTDSKAMATGASGALSGAAKSGKDKEQPIGWLLRELRPVSFNLKHGPEAKYLKFGFIAQELETVFPNLVRTTAEDTKAVASQDLIAVLTLALQNLQKELEEQRRDADEMRSRMERLERVVFSTMQV